MKDKEKKVNILKTGILTMVAVFAIMGGYGGLVHCIDTNQLHAVDQQHTKTQERLGGEEIAYSSIPENSVIRSLESDYGVKGYKAQRPKIKEIDVSTRDIAAKAVNPVPVSVESIESGKDLFFYYCSRCHGKDGDGRGLMGSVPSLRRESKKVEEELSNYLSGYLGYKPNINASYVQDETVGEIYYTLTNGGEAIMPPYKDALSPRDRWDVINYMKHELNRVPIEVKELESLTPAQKVRAELDSSR